MSHDPTGKSDVHAEKGGEGVAMAWGHKGLRYLAEVLAHNPRFVAFVRSVDPTGGTAAGGLIRTVAGALNIPMHGQWGARLNALLDTFSFEVSEILEKDADRPIEEILGDKALMDKVHHAVDGFLDKTVWLVLEQVHDDKSCSIYQGLTATDSYKDREGKEQKRASKFPVTEHKLARVLKEKLDLCPKCFPAGIPAPEKHAPKKPESKKVSPAEICGAYLAEAKDDPAELTKREGQIAQLWQTIASIQDDELRGRIDGLNTRTELITLLSSMTAGRQAFEQALRQLEEPGMARAFGKLSRDVRRGIEGFVDGANAAAAKEIEEIDAETAAVRKRMNERNGGEIRDANGETVAKIVRPNWFVRTWRTLTEGLI